MTYRLKLLLYWFGTQWFKVREFFRGNVVLAHKITGNVRLGRNVFVSDFVRLISQRGGNILIADRSKIGTMSILEDRGGYIHIGRNTSVNSMSVLYGHGGLDIGDDCIFATGLVVIPASHVFTDPNIPVKEQGVTKKGVRIGNGVWLGARVTVLDGVHIGDGAVVGAGAVVTADIPDGAVAVGVPARVIKNR